MPMTQDRKLEDSRKRRTQEGALQRTRVDHELKSWPQFFRAIMAGDKTHDLRRSDDRNFRVGDRILLREFDPQSEAYTGETALVDVTYITSAANPCALSNEALHPNYCILSIRMAPGPRTDWRA